MPIEFLCPGCQRQYSVAERFARATVKCKTCGETMIVPPPADDELAEITSAPATKPAPADDELGLAPLDDDIPKRHPQQSAPQIRPAASQLPTRTVAATSSSAIGSAAQPGTAANMPPVRRPATNANPVLGAAALPGAAMLPGAQIAPMTAIGPIAPRMATAAAPTRPSAAPTVVAPLSSSAISASATSGGLPKAAWIAIGAAATVAISIMITVAVLRSGKSDDETPVASADDAKRTADEQRANDERAKAAFDKAETEKTNSDWSKQNRNLSGPRAPANAENPSIPNTNPVALPVATNPIVLPPVQRNKPELDLVAWTAQADPAPEATVTGKTKWAELEIPVADSERMITYSTRLGNFVAVYGGGFRDTRCGVIDLRDGKKRGPFPIEITEEQTMKLSEDGKFVAARVGHSNEHVIHVWSMDTGTLLQRFKPSAKPNIAWFDFARDNELVTFSKQDEATVLTVWNITDGRPLRQIAVTRKQIHLHNYSGATVSPTGKYLALGAESVLQVYDLVEGKCAGEVELPTIGNDNTPEIKGVAFSNDGSELAAMLSDHSKTQLTIWDAKTGKPLRDADFKTDHTHHQYRGPKLEWLVDDSAWLIDGRAIYSRQAAETPIFEFPREAGFNLDRLKVLDLSTAVMVENKPFGRGAILKTVKLPGDLLIKRIAAMRTGGDLLDAELPPLTKADVAGLRTIDITARPAAWKYRAKAVDPAPAGVKTQVTMSETRWTPSRLIASSPDAGKLLVDKHNLNSPDDATRQLERYDLLTGKPDGSVPVHPEATLLDVSSDGSLAIFASGKRFARLDIVSLNTKAPVVGWRPLRDLPALPVPTGRNIAADNSQFSPENVTLVAAGIVDEQHVVAADSAGRIMGWQLPQCKATFLRPGQGRLLAMSHCRRYFVTANHQPDGGLQIVDAKSGETAGLIAFAPRELRGDVQVAFRPDGAALAVLSKNFQHVSVTRCELGSGKRDLEALLPPMTGAASLQWSGNTFLLYDKLLIDLDRRAVVWNYDFKANGSWSDPVGMRHWLATQTPDGRGRLLSAIAMPSDRVLQAIPGVTPAQPLLAPGVKISVAANVSVPNVNQEPLMAMLKSRFEAQGYIIDDSSPVRVTFTALERSTGRQLTVTDRRDILRREQTHFNQLEIDCQLKLSFAGGNERTTMQRTFPMATFGTLHTEHAEQKLQDDMRKSFVSFAESVMLPAYVFQGTAATLVPRSLVGPFSEEFVAPSGVRPNSN